MLIHHVITLSRIFKSRLWGLRSTPPCQMREFFLNPFLLVQQHRGKPSIFWGVWSWLFVFRSLYRTPHPNACLRVLQHHSSGYRSRLITKVPFTAPFLALLWCYMGPLTMVQALLSLTALAALETAPPQRMEPFGLVITAQHPGLKQIETRTEEKCQNTVNL